MAFRRRSRCGKLGETADHALKCRGPVVVAVYVDVKEVLIGPKKSVVLTVLCK